MDTCKKCGLLINEEFTYCPNCGTNNSQIVLKTKRSKKSYLPKRIIGFALSVEGLLVALTGIESVFIYVFLSSLLTFSNGVIYLFLSAPFGIAGLIMSCKNITNGDRNVLNKLGKIFGIVSSVLNGIILFITFISLLLLIYRYLG